MKICEPSTTRNWNVNFLVDEVEVSWHFHQLFRQMRHRSVKRWQTGVDDLLHGVPLYLLLRPHTARRSGRTRGALRRTTDRRAPAGSGGLPDRGRVVLFAPSLSPSPGLLLSRWGCVVSLCQGHGDAQTLVPKPLS